MSQLYVFSDSTSRLLLGSGLIDDGFQLHALPKTARHLRTLLCIPHVTGLKQLVEDGLPDSWGKLLARHFERALARSQERMPKELTRLDYLEQIPDELRCGALRLSYDAEGSAFLSTDDVRLPEIGDLDGFARISREIESNCSLSVQTLRGFVIAGRGLGGSRPKVNCIGPDGDIWIAKLPSISDRRDKAAWEWVVTKTAQIAGIHVSEFDLTDASEGGRIFLTRRFDRTRPAMRRHFFSAHALVSRARKACDHSYLEIVDLIEKLTPSRQADLEELWRRVAFQILIGNGDDHLRNHGFLLNEDGWHLAPAYDLNPSVSSTRMTLSFDENCFEFNLDALLSAAPVWGLSVERARELIEQVIDAVSYWEHLARSIDLPTSEIEFMRPAFKLY